MGRSTHSFPPHRALLDIPLANGHGLVPPTSSVDQQQQQQQSSSTIPPLHLNHREESTRLQLQRQRLREQYASVIVGKTIPGFKTSAAFFASLRTNLRLNASPPPSPISTPPSMVGSAHSLQPPSPLSTPVDSVMGDSVDAPTQEDPLAGVPELNTYLTTDEDEKVAALKLVADSIAQMRQTANNALISNPINLASACAIVAVLARYLLDRGNDILTVGFTCMGVAMIGLAACRYATKKYLFEAEAIKWSFLDDVDVIITKFGEEIIGTVMIYWASGEGRQKRKKAWRGEIKAWTVRLKYRRKGVGVALLEEAVKEHIKKGAESLEFAEEHANSLRVLPSFYNGRLDRRDKNARELLQDLMESSPGRSKRK